MEEEKQEINKEVKVSQIDHQDDEQEKDCDNESEIVIKTELNVDIQDTAQPTQEEIVEFEKFAKHFPKVGTKAEARMLKEDEQNIEETSSETSDTVSQQTTTQNIGDQEVKKGAEISSKEAQVVTSRPGVASGVRSHPKSISSANQVQKTATTSVANTKRNQSEKAQETTEPSSGTSFTKKVATDESKENQQTTVKKFKSTYEVTNSSAANSKVLKSASNRKESEEMKQTDKEGKKTKKRKFKAKKLVLNVSQTKYQVLRYVARSMFKMRLSGRAYQAEYDDPNHEWDILWCDNLVQVNQLYKMKPYQRINHFPGMYALARKDHLARNLQRMQKAHPEDYKFFPPTWLLPAEFGDFKKQFGDQSGKRRKKLNRKTFISKPEAAAQGRGIFLTRNIDDFDPYEHYVVQRYLHKPFLIDKLKFDLRIYVFLCGVNPLRMFFYKEGLCRLATAEYKSPNEKNLDNLYMHLTNYAINKTSSAYVQNKGVEKDDCGHKRSLTFAMKYIDQLGGHDSQTVLHDIKSTIIKTLCAVQPMLAHTYRSCQPDDLENSMCFEILGFDIFLDADLKPWILEVNHCPSFSTDSPLDFKIKKNLIADSFKLLNLSFQRKINLKRMKQLEFQRRAVRGKTRMTQEERDKLREMKARKRHKYEMKNLGNFELLYPCEEFPIETFQPFLDSATQIQQDINGTGNGGNKNRRTNTESTNATSEGAAQQASNNTNGANSQQKPQRLASARRTVFTQQASSGAQQTNTATSTNHVQNKASTYEPTSAKAQNNKTPVSSFSLDQSTTSHPSAKTSKTDSNLTNNPNPNPINTNSSDPYNRILHKNSASSHLKNHPIDSNKIDNQTAKTQNLTTKKNCSLHNEEDSDLVDQEAENQPRKTTFDSQLGTSARIYIIDSQKGQLVEGDKEKQTQQMLRNRDSDYHQMETEKIEKVHYQQHTLQSKQGSKLVTPQLIFDQSQPSKNEINANQQYQLPLSNSNGVVALQLQDKRVNLQNQTKFAASLAQNTTNTSVHTSQQFQPSSKKINQNQLLPQQQSDRPFTNQDLQRDLFAGYNVSYGGVGNSALQNMLDAAKKDGFISQQQEKNGEGLFAGINTSKSLQSTNVTTRRPPSGKQIIQQQRPSQRSNGNSLPNSNQHNPHPIQHKVLGRGGMIDQHENKLQSLIQVTGNNRQVVEGGFGNLGKTASTKLTRPESKSSNRPMSSSLSKGIYQTRLQQKNAEVHQNKNSAAKRYKQVVTTTQDETVMMHTNTSSMQSLTNLGTAGFGIQGQNMVTEPQTTNQAASQQVQNQNSKILQPGNHRNHTTSTTFGDSKGQSTTDNRLRGQKTNLSQSDDIPEWHFERRVSALKPSNKLAPVADHHRPAVSQAQALRGGGLSQQNNGQKQLLSYSQALDNIGNATFQNSSSPHQQNNQLIQPQPQQTVGTVLNGGPYTSSGSSRIVANQRRNQQLINNGGGDSSYSQVGQLCKGAPTAKSLPRQFTQQGNGLPMGPNAFLAQNQAIKNQGNFRLLNKQHQNANSRIPMLGNHNKNGVNGSHTTKSHFQQHSQHNHTGSSKLMNPQALMAAHQFSAAESINSVLKNAGGSIGLTNVGFGGGVQNQRSVGGAKERNMNFGRSRKDYQY